MTEQKAVNNAAEVKAEDVIAALTQELKKKDDIIWKLNEELKMRENVKQEMALAKEVQDNNTRVIRDYLQSQIDYAEVKIKELQIHLLTNPNDEYSKVDLQNTYVHLNYLRASLRRLNLCI